MKQCHYFYLLVVVGVGAAVAFGSETVPNAPYSEANVFFFALPATRIKILSPSLSFVSFNVFPAASFFAPDTVDAGATYASASPTNPTYASASPTNPTLLSVVT